MASPAGWVPVGWAACNATCRPRPVAPTPPQGPNDRVCPCCSNCLNEGQCGCRAVRRPITGRTPGGRPILGKAKVIEPTCGTVFKRLARHVDQCHCLHRAPGGGKKERRVGKYEVFKDRGGKYRFRLKASNGEIVLASQAYTTEYACVGGAFSVQKNGPQVERYVSKRTRGGKYRFVLRAANNKVIGTSESYESAAEMKRGIKAVQRASVTNEFVSLV